MPTDTLRLILGFLRKVGLEVTAGAVSPDTFLPGIHVSGGQIVFDGAALRFPGDLLHEAGHLAVLPPADRVRFGADDSGFDLNRLEVGAVAWSYAAATHLGLDPAVVFHGGGYRGKGPQLAFMFSVGVHPGANVLEDAGLALSPGRAREAGVEPYPHMLAWLAGAS